MAGQRVNRFSSRALVILSCIAFATVFSGYFQPPKSDEGTAAHIFQLSIVALGPTILLFLVTADWKRPRSSAPPLALAGILLVLAFAGLYYLEHYR